jgi:hypothetical protein
MVNRRDAATLLPIIQNVTRPGGIIHSDQWRAYHGIQQQLGLQHRTVNRRVTFWMIGRRVAASRLLTIRK